MRVGSSDKLACQDNLKPAEPAEVEDAYWELGDLRPSHLISFAYQIACGMVSACHHVGSKARPGVGCLF